MPLPCPCRMHAGNIIHAFQNHAHEQSMPATAAGKLEISKWGHRRRHLRRHSRRHSRHHRQSVHPGSSRRTPCLPPRPCPLVCPQQAAHRRRPQPLRRPHQVLRAAQHCFPIEPADPIGGGLRLLRFFSLVISRRHPSFVAVAAEPCLAACLPAEAPLESTRLTASQRPTAAPFLVCVAGHAHCTGPGLNPGHPFLAWEAPKRREKSWRT
mmetsp:Transcript_24965/g.73825  ORF Transcript_24965/g.73825 Transcript_24965/m.73825 type:complete len:210 (-) Transcript_24965:163-792(-)